VKTVTFEDIKAFALGELWPLPDPISGHTALAHDFGVAGLDGKEFMEKFAARFAVDLGAFDWVEYFGAEVGPTPLSLVRYWYRRSVLGIPARELLELPEISLAHLVKCANQGRWEAPASVLAPPPDPS
jgi:hypothetical protein